MCMLVLVWLMAAFGHKNREEIEEENYSQLRQHVPLKQFERQQRSRFHFQESCSTYAPINIMPHYPPYGQMVGNIGALTEGGSRHLILLEYSIGLHILHSYTACVKSPLILYLLQGDCTYIGAVNSPPCPTIARTGGSGAYHLW